MLQNAPEGGLAAAILTGSWQRQIGDTARLKMAAISTGKTALTGINAFPRLGNDSVSAATPWPSPETRAVELNGARAMTLVPFRPSAPFERLRDAAEELAFRTGQAPCIFLACLGPLARHAARATWMTNFLASGGIAVTQSAPLLQSSEAGQAFAASGATIACLCGDDATYGELGEATVMLLKTVGAKHVLMAGRPRSHELALKAAGVDEFIFAGGDMVETLSRLLAVFGVVRGAV